LVYLPAPRLKAVESLLHSFLSSLHVLRKNVDVIYFLDPANAPFCALLRLFGKRVVTHTDGLGWKRRKWGPLARRYYKLVEWVCARCATALVTDNPAMQEYYRAEYGANSSYIPYGSASRYGVDESVYDELGLTPGGYLLVVARLEPENNADFLIEEYSRTAVKLPLIVVGDWPYSPQFKRRLDALANDRVLFVGRVNDQRKLNALYKGAYLYLHGHEVGGTNPSLLRAMQAGATPVVIDVPFNTYVIGDCGFTFQHTTGALSRLLECLVTCPAEVEHVGRKAKLRVESKFNWNSVVQDHVRLFRGLMQKA
jgi:glycosyltransferase involved in cell wall biosynthesis